jgi:nitrogen-specific signal transduction histidine kinase
LVLLAKNRLDAIKASARMLQTRTGDRRIAEFFSQTIDSDVDKTDALVRRLMNYVRASTPVKKTHSVQTLIEKVLKKHQFTLEQKKVKIFRGPEGDLPETTVSDEHLWYILDSLLDYIVTVIPPFETVGITTRVAAPGRKGPGEDSSNEPTIEIQLVSTGHSVMQDPSWKRLGIPDLPEDEPTDLPLLLIREVVGRDRGRIKFESNEGRSRTRITLTLPVERRKVFYYMNRQE